MFYKFVKQKAIRNFQSSEIKCVQKIYCFFFQKKVFKIQKPNTLYISDIPSLCADVDLFVYICNRRLMNVFS